VIRRRDDPGYGGPHRPSSEVIPDTENRYAV
jgi:hypothetical protein